jgi:hypothetical protein
VCLRRAEGGRRATAVVLSRGVERCVGAAAAWAPGWGWLPLVELMGEVSEDKVRV